MHKIAMHILFKHFSIDEILATKLIDLLTTNEFVLIVNNFAVLFF
jgi:hypothetical protein